MTDRPWFEFYDTGIPHSLKPYPETTLFEIVSDNARQRPDQPAIYFMGTWMSWSELDKLSDVFARILLDMGLVKGERVALLMPNCPQFLICQLGAWKAGAIVSPLNPRYTESELKHSLKETGAATGA